MQFRHTCRRTSSAGIALVLVLSVLVLITGIVLAFFISVTAESASATSYASGASAKMLAASAMNLVQAQIRDATRGQEESSGAGAILSWASQPGMIRTY